MKAALALVLLLASCAHIPQRADWLKPVRRSQPLLGTFVTITAYGASEETVAIAVNEAFEQFRKVDKLMSIHRADSEISTVNHEAGQRPVPISPELFDVLQEAQNISSKSGGAFDVTIAPLTQLWGFVWKQYKFPEREAVEEARAHVNYRALELNASARTVRFTTNGISVDLGGIGKGYAVDLAIETLQRRGVAAAMVKAGGDLRVFGNPPGLDAWEIQLEDPAKSGERVSLQLRESALSTSGNYENYFMHEGVRYSHIIDPRTGWPVQGVVSCTVVAPTCTQSDAWATALFIMSPERANKIAGLEYMITLAPTNSATEALATTRSPGFPALSR